MKKFKTKGFIPIINGNTEEDGENNRIFHSWSCYQYNMNDIRNFDIGEITVEEKQLIKNHRLLNNPDRRSGVFIGKYKLITEDIEEKETLQRMKDTTKTDFKNDNVFCLDGKEEVYFNTHDAIRIMKTLNGVNDFYIFLSCGRCYNNNELSPDFISSNNDEDMEISDKDKLKELVGKWLLKLGLRESLFR